MVVNQHRWSSALFLFVDFFKSGYLQQLDTWGMDGEVLQIMMPSEQEVYKLVSTSEKYYKTCLGNTASARRCASSHIFGYMCILVLLNDNMFLNN